MNDSKSSYIGLIASLPNLLDPFVHRHPPISRVQLFKRLNMLDYDDGQTIHQIASVFLWSELSIQDSDAIVLDAQILRNAERIISAIESEELQQWLEWRMEFRSVIAALRIRKSANEAPKNQSWAYRTISHHLAANWSKPDFGLGGRFQWISEANAFLERGESAELERLLLTACWKFYQQQQAQNPYGLAQVWLYIARWDLVNRWCSYGEKQSELIFNNLLASSVEESILKLRESV